MIAETRHFTFTPGMQSRLVMSLQFYRAHPITDGSGYRLFRTGSSRPGLPPRSPAPTEPIRTVLRFEPAKQARSVRGGRSQHADGKHNIPHPAGSRGPRFGPGCHANRVGAGHIGHGRRCRIPTEYGCLVITLVKIVKMPSVSYFHGNIGSRFSDVNVPTSGRRVVEER